MNNKDQIIKKICQHIPDTIAIYQFGSIGTTYETRDSDLDLAILAKNKIDEKIKWQTIQEVAFIAKRDVDLADLNQASTVLQHEILSSGKLIFCTDKTACDFFDNKVFSMYLRFNEERKELLDDIKKRGSIYG